MLLLTLPCALQAVAQSPRPKLILDCDTANEIDDLYAIVRMLNQDKFDVLGLSSAQWFHYLGKQDSVQASQQDNEDLVRILGRTDLPTPMGAERPMGKPWGGDEAKDSPAAQFIIKHARAVPAGQRIHVVCTGALTNLASAIKLAPDIAPKIVASLMGFRYDDKKAVWDKSEFNVRRDLNAADFLLNQPSLELHVMSATVSGAFKFDRDDTFARHEKMGKLGRYLTGKWKSKFRDSKTWVMWDLALVEAMLCPGLATEVQVMTPPENRQRKVWIYDSIDTAAMHKDYWSVAEQAAKTASN